MKKRILSAILVVVLMLSVTGCNYSTLENEGETKEESAPSMFVCVEQAATWKIVYHRDTKVMYAISYYGSGSGEFTLLVNADGTPMLWEK